MPIALYQPDIPQNVGSIARLCACMETPLHIIEPCGFPFDDKRFKRAAMDYGDQVQLQRHSSWQAFQHFCSEELPNARLILLSTKGASQLTRFNFEKDDILLFGRESAGVPDEVHSAANHAIMIPISTKTRSLNVAQSAAIALAEALRQTATFPTPEIS